MEKIKKKIKIIPGHVGHGNEVHFLYNGKSAICGAGKCSTGSRWGSTTTSTPGRVTCVKCKKSIEKYRKLNEYFEYIILEE